MCEYYPLGRAAGNSLRRSGEAIIDSPITSDNAAAPLGRFARHPLNHLQHAHEQCGIHRRADTPGEHGHQEVGPDLCNDEQHRAAQDGQVAADKQEDAVRAQEAAARAIDFDYAGQQQSADDYASPVDARRILSPESLLRATLGTFPHLTVT